MKRLALSLAFLSAAMLAQHVPAGEPEKPGIEAEARQAESGTRGPGARGLGRRLPGRQGAGGGGAAERDPAAIVARLMQEFDKDGDQKLDSTELTALLTSMRERRGQVGLRGGGTPRQAQGDRPGAGGRRRGGDGAPGGKRPNRPEAE